MGARMLCTERWAMQGRGEQCFWRKEHSGSADLPLSTAPVSWSYRQQSSCSVALVCSCKACPLQSQPPRWIHLHPVQKEVESQPRGTLLLSISSSERRRSMYQGLKDHCFEEMFIKTMKYLFDSISQLRSQQTEKITTLTTTEVCLKCHLINILSGQSNISTERKNLCIWRMTSEEGFRRDINLYYV